MNFGGVVLGVYLFVVLAFVVKFGSRRTSFNPVVLSAAQLNLRMHNFLCMTRRPGLLNGENPESRLPASVACISRTNGVCGSCVVWVASDIVASTSFLVFQTLAFER